MIGKFLSQFEEVDPAPQEFLEAEGDHVVVTVRGVGKTKSGNDLSGDSTGSTRSKRQVARGEFFGDTATAVEALR